MSEIEIKKGKESKGGRSAAPLKILPPLTENQGKCLIFILNYYSEHRNFPTHREIAEAMGIKSTTAAMYLDPLVEKGYLKRAGKGKQARNIRLTHDGLERLRILGAAVPS